MCLYYHRFLIRGVFIKDDLWKLSYLPIRIWGWEPWCLYDWDCYECSCGREDKCPKAFSSLDLRLPSPFCSCIRLYPSFLQSLLSVALEDEDSKKDDGISFSNQTGPAWAGSERDYTYEELLNRVFNIMREKNPDMVAGEKRKFVMKPPQVVRVGTKKTSFVNFTDICKL